MQIEMRSLSLYSVSILQPDIGRIGWHIHLAKVAIVPDIAWRFTFRLQYISEVLWSPAEPSFLFLDNNME